MPGFADAANNPNTPTNSYGAQFQQQQPQQQQQPSTTDQLGAATGQIGGTAFGSYLGAQAVAPPVASAGMAGAGEVSQGIGQLVNQFVGAPAVAGGASSGGAGAGGAAAGAGGGLAGAATTSGIIAGAIASALNAAKLYGQASNGLDTDLERETVQANFGAPGGWGIHAANQLFGGRVSDEDVNRFAFGQANPAGFLANELGVGSNNDFVNSTLLMSGTPLAALMAIGNMTGFNFFGSGKSERQQKRDRYRDSFQRLGLIDDNYNIKLADGSTYDIGVDGGAKLKNVAANINGGSDRFTYDVDFSNPEAEQVVGWLQPLVVGLYGEDGHDMLGHLANAAMSSGDAKANVMQFYETVGLDRDKAYAMVLDQSDPNKVKDPLEDARRDAYLAGLDNLYGVENPNAN